jgi:hypothetical protein
MRRPFIARGFGGDDVVTAAVPPYYGALVGARTIGAADRPAVRRVHGARTAARFEAPRLEKSVGRWGLGWRVASGRGGRWEGARARTPRFGRRAAGDARRTGTQRRGVPAPRLELVR